MTVPARSNATRRSAPWIIFCVFSVSIPASAQAADQVWAYVTAYNVLDRYSFAGANQGTHSTPSRGDRLVAMAVVGNEVWAYVTAYNVFDRYSIAGVNLGTYPTPSRGDRSAAMAVVGNEVWTYVTAYNVIDRTSFTGVNQGTHSTPSRGDRAVAMAVVGNEVWAYVTAYNVFDRYSLAGVNLGTHPTPSRGDRSVVMAVAGNELWAYVTAYNVFDRYSFTGVNLGTYSTPSRGDRFAGMAVAGNEVWTYVTAYNVIDRFSFGGVNLGTHSTPSRGDRALAMVAIQEPDCNSNGASDYDDINTSASIDCNTNLLPDECEIDAASTAPGGPYYCTEDCASDCNNDGIPDECQTDCNDNDIPDDCDLTAVTSEDCNSNSVPDECDIAGPISDDCNTNQIPDECDISAATSDDCNGNDVSDECESGSGDIYWAGPDGGQFQTAANWNPATVPLSAGNAIFENSGPTDNRCIVDSTPGPICSLAVQATGSGRQIVQINAGVTLETNSGTTVSAGGDIRLEGGELGGGAVANTSDSITGHGTLSANLINAGHVEGESFRLLSLTGATLDNQTGGKIVAPLASGIEVLSANVQQAGEVEIHAIGACRFTEAIFNAPGGSITLLGGAIGSRDAAGLENGPGAVITGTGTIDCTLANYGQMVVIADMLVVGDLVNEGTITIQSGLLTVIGNVSGGGTIIGGFGG